MENQIQSQNLYVILSGTSPDACQKLKDKISTQSSDMNISILATKEEFLQTKMEDGTAMVVDVDRITSLSHRPENLINNLIGKVSLTYDEFAFAPVETKGFLNKIKSGLRSLIIGTETAWAKTPFFIASNWIIEDYKTSKLPTGTQFLTDLIRFAERLALRPKSIKVKGMATDKPVSTGNLLNKWKFRIGFAFSGFKSGKELAGNGERRVFRSLFAVATFALLLYFPLASFNYGISGDEYVHHVHAEYVIDYFTGGERAAKALDDPKTLLHFYGQSFDLLAKVLINTFNIEDEYTFRHFLNSFFGFLALLFTALLVKRLFGYRGALVATLFLLISPRFMGHSMNNPMDIPFAFGYIFTIYHIIKAFREYPILRLRSVFFIAIGIGYTISIRVGGILLMPMLVFFVGLIYLDKIGWNNILKVWNLKKHPKLVILPIYAIIAGYFIGILPWPYALEAPLTAPLKALAEFSNIGVSIRQLFEGERLLSQDMPWYYIPKFIYMTVPIVIFVGLIGYLIAYWKRIVKFEPIHIFIGFTMVFPIVYVIYEGSNVYGGWRHLMFVYQPMIVLASLGALGLFYRMKKPVLCYSYSGVMLVLIALPVIWSAKNHPHEYIYYNEFVGGPSGVYGDYEMDYYYRSTKEASDWLINHIDWASRKDTVWIASNKQDAVKQYFRNIPNARVFYTTYYAKASRDWEYGVFTNSYIDGNQLKAGYFPPKEDLYNVKSGKAVLTTVTKNPSRDAFLGFEAMKRGKRDEALGLFQRYLKVNPESEEVYLGMANIYAQQGNVNACMRAADSALKYHPEYASALELKGRIYLQQRKFAEALPNFQLTTKYQDNYYTSYYYAAICLANLNRNKEAAEEIEKCILKRPDFKEAYQLGADVYKKLGNRKRANAFTSAFNQLNRK